MQGGQAKDSRSTVQAACALLAAVALAAVAVGLVPLAGHLGADDSSHVRSFVIGLIRLTAFGLAVCGAGHAAFTWRWPARQQEALRARLARLAEAAPLPELLVQAAHEREHDVCLALLQWGTRALLLLGFLGTVWGLSLAVSPIASAVATVGAQGAVGAPRPPAEAAAGASGAEEVLAKTGAAVGSLGTAFATTLWGVICATLVLLLSTLCAGARETRLTACAWEILWENDFLNRAEQQRHGYLQKAGQTILVATRRLEGATATFAAAVDRVVGQQDLLERTLDRLAGTLDAIAGQIEASLGPVAEELKGAAKSVSTAAGGLKRASETGGRHLTEAAAGLAQSAATLETASSSLTAQQGQALGAYRQELRHAADGLNVVLQSLARAVGELPSAFREATVPAVEAVTQQELAGHQELVDSLRQSIEALQTFLYWADQSTDRRETGAAERDRRLLGALAGVVKVIDDNLQRRAAEQEPLHEIVEGVGELAGLVEQLGGRLDELVRLEQERGRRLPATPRLAEPPLPTPLSSLLPLETDGEGQGS